MPATPGPAPRAPASHVRAFRDIGVGGGSRAAQALDGAALVHGPVALCGLIEGQLKVEDPAGVDLAVPDQAEQLGQEPAYRRGTAKHVHFGVEKLLAGQLDAVSPADVADVPAGAGGADGLHHRLLGADGLDDRVRAEPAGELLDLRHALIAALGDDVGRAELAGELLAGLVPAHRDDPP